MRYATEDYDRAIAPGQQNNLKPKTSNPSLISCEVALTPIIPRPYSYLIMTFCIPNTREVLITLTELRPYRPRALASCVAFTEISYRRVD